MEKEKTEGNRFTLTVTEDILKDVEQLKKDHYFDKPYSELYRDLIILGIKSIKKQLKA